MQPFFYVENPTNVVPFRFRDDAPMLNVSFNGTRRNVLIQDVIAVNGPRQPAAAQSPRVHRQAFIFLVAQTNVSNSDIDKVDRIRREWEPFFVQATGNRMRAETRLRP